MNWLPSFRFTRPYVNAPLLILPLAFSAMLISCPASTHGQTTTIVNSGEVLRIGTGTLEDDRLLLNGGTISTTASPRQSTIQGTIELLDSSSILGNDGVLTVEGVISGQADSSLTFRRDSVRGGVVRLSGANEYEGLTVIDSGLVIAGHETALGSNGHGTSIENTGQLQVEVANSEAYSVSGILGFDSQIENLRFTQDEDITNDILFSSGVIELAGQGNLSSRIMLDQEGESEAALRGFGVNVSGGVGGTGNLTLGGSLVFGDAGLDHSGDTIVASGNNNQFNAANSYGGDTIVRGGSTTLEVNHSSALGTSNNAVTVQDGGRLVLNQNIDRAVVLEDGSRLTVGTGAVFDGNIIVRDFSNVVGGDGTFRGNIATLTDISLAGGDFEGAIVGLGSVRTSGTTRLNAANNYSGLTITGGETEINHPNSLGTLDVGTRIGSGVTDLNTTTEETLTVSNGTLNVNVPQRLLPRTLTNINVNRNAVVSLNGSGQYDEVADVSQTELAVRGESQVSGIVVRNGGSVSVDSGRLTTDNLDIYDGSISGEINALSIRKLGRGTAELNGLTNFGSDILVDSGTVSVGVGGFGSTNGVTRVASQNATLSIPTPSSGQTRVVQEDIFLNNATGIRNEGGLNVGAIFGRTVRLEGRLDLGETGSTINAGFSRDSSNSQGIFEITGQVTGGDLELLGGTTLLSGGDYDYTGQTIVRNGSLLLRDVGRLENTSGIELRNSRLSIGGFNTQGVQLSNDRISDLATVDSFNGDLSLSTGSQETLGNLRLNRGVTSIDLSTEANLELNDFGRGSGTLLRVTEDSIQSLRIGNSSHAAGEVIPFLSLRSDASNFSGFATINEAGRIVPLALRSVAIDDAIESDNVFAIADDVLNSSKTVASIFVDSLDLGGNRLKVESGAVSRVRSGNLTNGELTAGASGDYELIFSGGSARVDANIVDDGENAVSLTIGIGTSLSGVNSYSGTTTVNSDLTLLSPDALPNNAVLDIFGGQVEYSGLAASQRQFLDRIRIVDGGSLESSFGSAVEIDFNRLELEEGEVGRDVSLQGDGEIVKTGPGSSSLRFANTNEFSGTVTVQDGVLISGKIDDQALFRVEGGELQVTAGSDPRFVPAQANSNRFELAGGDLTVFASSGTREGLSGSISITDDSRILLGEDIFLDTEMTGTGDLEIAFSRGGFDGRRFLDVRTANENYSGDVTIGHQVGATLSHTDSLGTGNLTITDGGSLGFFSAFVGDFVNGQPTATIDRAITLDNGSLAGSSGNTPILADVEVKGFSTIQSISNIEDLSLGNLSRLTLHDSSTINKLEVVGEAGLEFGLETASRIEATVFSGAPNSVLDLQDRKLVDTELSLSYNLVFGQSLEVLSNGQSIELALEQGQRLSGSGTLVNSAAIFDGGVISPDSEFAGALTVDGSLMLGEASIYEFNGNFDDLSIGLLSANQFISDLLVVTDDLIFGASENQPFTLDLSGDERFLSFLNGDEEFSFNIASANEIIGFDETAVQYRGVEPGTGLFLRTDGRNLILSNFVSVPEPSSVFVLVGLSLTLVSRRSRQ